MRSLRRDDGQINQPPLLVFDLEYWVDTPVLQLNAMMLSKFQTFECRSFSILLCSFNTEFEREAVTL